MRGKYLILVSFLCLNACLTQLLHGSAKRGPLSPKEATQAMLKLMPNEKGFLTKLKSLIKAGADTNAKNKSGRAMLDEVALRGGSAAAANLLIDNSSVTKEDDFRKATLFFALYTDNVAVATVIAATLDADELSRLDYDGKAPLHYALEYGGARMVEVLLEHGSNPNAAKLDGTTPLLHLVKDAKTAALIIAKGGDLNATNDFGQTPLHHIGDAKMAALLIDKGGDPNAEDEYGRTPLHTAVQQDRYEVAELLIEKGSDPKARNNYGKTPLHYVKNAEMAALLIKKGSDPNARDDKDETPLHKIRDAKSVRIFEQHGADLNARDERGKTPLDHVINSGSEYIGEYAEALKLLGAETSDKRGEDNASKNDSSTSSSNDNYGNNTSSEKKLEQPDYLSNLTEQARTKNNPPFIGREQELEQVVNSLRRKGMRGTVLVGDPGVGKTAIVEALAHMLAKGELPELADREIFALDVGTMWGHEKNQYVGQLHKRVNDALKFIAAEPEKRILFIDEIHQLLSGRYVSTSGSPPITDVFKPFLGRDMQLIGLTTHDEYQRIIEGDRAIVDRLLRIDIDEPSNEDTLAILRGIKGDYEKHHDIAIGDATLQAVVSLSNRYMASQQQPRKAISLLDEAASALPHDAKRLTKKHIATIVAKKIGIEVATILKSKNEKAAGLLPALQEHIYGQDHALETVNSSLAIAFADLAEETQPMAVFLLAGPTGVGKTETAKVIAQQMFDSEDNFITADMSNYKHPTSVAALTELLTRAVKAKPHSVILLDEVEKAHPEVRHLLLQLLDEGRLTDNRQRKVDFTNTIIVLTTNSKEIEKDFAPELLNRFNKRITYNKLSTDVSMRLVQKQLDRLNRSLQKEKITISLSQATKRIIAKEGYSQEYGAREMVRVFEQLVKYPLADGINRGVVPSKQDYHIDLQSTGSERVKASLILDAEVLLEVTISIQTLGKKNENNRGIN